MNIYFINPKDFDPSNFHHLIEMLKVTAIYSLIPENEEVVPMDYISVELREHILFDDLSFIPLKPQNQYQSAVSQEIVKYICSQEDFHDYFEAMSWDLEAKSLDLNLENDAVSNLELPYSHSRSNDFVNNILKYNDPNLLVLCYKVKIPDLPKLIYNELYKKIGRHDYEQIIPIVKIGSWANNPESNITSVWRRTTKEEKKHMSYYIRDAKTHRLRPMTYTERKRCSYGSFEPVTMNDLGKESKFSYYGIHYDPICYLYKKMFPLSTDDDEMRLKIELAHLLLTEEAQHQMNEKLEELAEERREMEYQEWLHADEIDDTDYERETYYALGGEDYDRFREEGGNIDDMMDGLGF
jgi:hypothetical protein